MSSALASVKENPTNKLTITSAPNGTSALQLASGIRGHWGIENRLHSVKDVIFGEDAAPFTNYNRATNWSIIRNIIINLARMCGYDSLTKAERFLAHDIDQLFSLVE